MKKIIVIIILIIIVGGISGLVGYMAYNPLNNISNINNNISDQIELQMQIAEQDNNIYNQENHQTVAIIENNKIIPSTKMIYKYYYTEDNITQIVEDVPAYFLINLTKKDLEENFSEWQIEEFSSEEVVLKKIIEGQSTQHYIIKDYDGYLAIYYNTPLLENILKDITDIPIDSLSKDEQDNIINGLEIDGEENLRILIENYHS